jgi:hypothetical protein
VADGFGLVDVATGLGDAFGLAVVARGFGLDFGDAVRSGVVTTAASVVTLADGLGEPTAAGLLPELPPHAAVRLRSQRLRQGPSPVALGCGLLSPAKSVAGRRPRGSSGDVHRGF